MSGSYDENDGKYGRLPPYYENLFRQTPEEKIVSIYSRGFYPGLSGVGVFISLVLYNKATRRPLHSGIQKFFIGVPIAMYIGEQVRKYYQRSSAERDAMIRHYIMLHPEDFPEPERKKYRDVFQKWLPER